MKLHHKILGEGQQTIVILHGLFGLLDNWGSIAKALAENYKVVLADQRNHGRSPHSIDFNYDLLAGDLAELIDDLELDQPIVIGHSMGGKTLMKFAHNYPEKLTKAIVVDISPREYPIHHQQILLALNSVQLEGLKSRSEADKQMSEHIKNIGIRQFLLKNLYRTPEKTFAWRMNLPVLTEKIGNVVAGLSPQHTIDTPTLFIGGKNSDYIEEKDHELIHTTFSNATIEMVDNAGHWIHAEQPKALLDLITSFIK